MTDWSRKMAKNKYLLILWQQQNFCVLTNRNHQNVGHFKGNWLLIKLETQIPKIPRYTINLMVSVLFTIEKNLTLTHF